MPALDDLNARPGHRHSFGALAPDEFEHRLGELLLKQSMIDDRSLNRARSAATESRTSLIAVLVQLGLVNESRLAEIVAQILDLPTVADDEYPDTQVLADRLRAKFLRKVRAVPLACDETHLRLAVVDPFDQFTPQAVAVATGREVSISIGMPVELDAALDRLYPETDRPHDAAELAGLAGSWSANADEDAERLKDLASEAPIVRLVNQLIARAVEMRASDIHIEPFENRLRIRYRYDGVLHEVEEPPAKLTPAIVSRIKIMARLDIAERRLPQDGRIKQVVRGNEIDLRVSTIPSLYGETVVLRVLDRTSVSFDFDRLGLSAELRAGVRNILGCPNGILLVTGPTGSGKTTTLYTALRELNSTERKVVTVEDPVEYQLPGVNQIQVKPQIGLTFATLLRSILRQDPDVIMIGEIRDLETAQIAVQAALTGHLVLSTLHTNNAASSITRLRDMGVEDYLLTATLKGVVAQRLVRRLCEACKHPVEADPDLILRFDLHRFVEAEASIHFHRAVGCNACRGTGYSGRIAVGEVLIPGEETHRLVLARADQTAIQRAAVTGGMRTMYDNGILEVLEGRTTLEELMRSIRSED